MAELLLWSAVFALVIAGGIFLIFAPDPDNKNYPPCETNPEDCKYCMFPCEKNQERGTKK